MKRIYKISDIRGMILENKIIQEFNDEDWSDTGIIEIDNNDLVKQLNMLTSSRKIRDYNLKVKAHNDKVRKTGVGELKKPKTDIYTFNISQHNHKKGKVPHIHPSSASFSTGKGKYDGTLSIEKFASLITKRPDSIVGRNSKMEKSDGRSTYHDGLVYNDIYYNTSIPAISGIVYNQSKGVFVNVSTCPGAGSCQIGCYALKNSYIIFEKTFIGMTQRLNFLMNDPKGYEDQLYSELKEICEKHKAINDEDEPSYNRIVFRWNDSGDFFGKKYYEIAKNVMKRLKSENFNIISTAYTKSGEIGIGGNEDDIDHLLYSYNGSKETERRKFDQNKNDNSRISITAADVINKDVSDWFKGRVDFTKRSGMVKAKEILWNEKDRFKLDIQSKDQIVSYDEIVNGLVPMKDKPYYYVIVRSGKEVGDGDQTTTRNDVKATILVFH